MCIVVERAVTMNIFQLFFANPAKLTVKQQALQHTLRTFVITVIGAGLAESYVLISQTKPVSIIVGTALVVSAMFATAGSAIVPFLQEQGVNAATITKIEQDIELLSSIVKDVAAVQQSAIRQQEQKKDATQ